MGVLNNSKLLGMQFLTASWQARFPIKPPLMGLYGPIRGGLRGKRTCHEAERDNIPRVFALAGPHKLLEVEKLH